MKWFLRLYQRPGKRQVASHSCWEGSESWPAVEPVGVGARFGKREMLLVLCSTAHAAANALGLFVPCQAPRWCGLFFSVCIKAVSWDLRLFSWPAGA